MSEKKRAVFPVIDQDAFAVFDFPNLTGTPERNLLMAILERAIRDYVGNCQDEVEAAQDWIFEENLNRPYRAFSFSWICQQLDLDPRKIAKTISEMPKRGEHRTAPWYFLKAS